MDPRTFFVRFPWVFQLPEKPLCKHCGYQSQFFIKDGKFMMTEFHSEDCPRSECDMKDHEIEAMDCQPTSTS